LNEIPFEILNSFSLSVLESIFSSEDLHIPNEDYFLSLISKLAEKDSNRKCLYKYILSQNLSKNILKEKFSNLQVEDIDFYILEIIKTRLFVDEQSSLFNYPPKRYTNSKRIEINDHDGIISALRKENPDSVSIEASSCYNASNWPVSNLFQHNDSNFITDHVPNSSICFSFHHHKVSISKYFIRALHNHNTGW
jgi:hypothetical protein